ncbi:MAG: hypothetical protein IT563_07505 [Alphaproteobacteria bacterium]|nr:hypothetical protein [Alphaproteobacteria bacterium]
MPDPQQPDPRTRGGDAVQRQSGLFGRKSTQPELAQPDAPPARPPGTAAPLPPRQRTGSVALVLLGAAAVGAGGGWAVDRLSQPACDPKLDPRCPPARSWFSASSGSSSSGSSGSSGSYGHSWGNWWGGDSATSTTPPARSDAASRAGQSTTQRGGFGAIGRFFSGGS